MIEFARRSAETDLISGTIGKMGIEGTKWSVIMLPSWVAIVLKADGASCG